MNSKATQTGPRQTPTARSGATGNRIRQDCPLARIAEVVRDHGLPARLRATSRLELEVGTTRFTAHLVPEIPGGIELRARREGRQSILALVNDPVEAAEILVHAAGRTAAWALTADVYDRLILAGETTVLGEVPMGETVYVRLGPRSYAEFHSHEADHCLGSGAVVALTTVITAEPVDRDWSFRRLERGAFGIRGQIAGGIHSSAGEALEDLSRHRARAAEWESLHAGTPLG